MTCLSNNIKISIVLLLIMYMPFLAQAQKTAKEMVEINSIFSKYDSLIIPFFKLKHTASIGNLKPTNFKNFHNNWKVLNERFYQYVDSVNFLLNRYYSLACDVEEIAKNMESLEGQLEGFYYEILGIKEGMDHYETAWQVDQLLKSVSSKVDLSINYLKDDIPDTLNYLQNYLSNEIRFESDELRDTIISNISELTNYNLLFVGPGLYIENTYAFSGLYKIPIPKKINEKPIVLKWFYRRSYLHGDLLYYSNGNVSKLGIALYYGIGIKLNEKSKFILLPGGQYLPDMREREDRKDANFHGAFGVLFKNREWATGFSWSIVTGGGIKLLIGI